MVEEEDRRNLENKRMNIMMEEFAKSEIKKIDKLYLDPSERATRIQQYLYPFIFEEHKEKPWDVVCWMAESIGMYAQVIEDKELENIARHLLMWLYSVHYSQPVELYGKPDREIKT